MHKKLVKNRLYPCNLYKKCYNIHKTDRAFAKEHYL